MNFIENKIIIRNNLSKDEQRNRYAYIASFIGITLNLIISIIKMICGIIYSNISVTTDGVNNLSDGATSFITLIGFKLSKKPADEDHPFGHARIEYITGFIISVIILFVAIQLLVTSIDKIVNKVTIKFSLLIVCVLFLSIVIKFWLFLFNRKVGRKIKSDTVIAVSKDSFNDIFVTLGVLFSMFVGYYFNVNIDGYIGLIISLLIAKTGYDLAKDTVSPIIGESPNQEIIKYIYDNILKYDKVLGVHDLIVHNYGVNKYFASVHVELDSNLDFVTTHEIADKIERYFEKKNINIIVHNDPVITNNCEYDEFKKILEDVLINIDKDITMHGFRYIIVNDKIKLVFDVVKPKSFKMTEDELLKNISQNLKKVNNSFECIVRIDEHYNNYGF